LGLTSPFIISKTDSVFELVNTLILFLKVPMVEVLYLTVIVPLSPGFMGSRGHSVAVQPQEATTLVSINGFESVLVNSNTRSPFEFCGIAP